MTKPPLDILLCAPRGFCAGVVRAIDAVERALARLWRAGLCPARDRPQQVRGREPEAEGRGLRARARRDARRHRAPVIFSAHGVPKSVPRGGRRAAALRHRRDLSARHQGASRGRDPSQARDGTSSSIGHAGHPEVVGTMGQLPQGAITLVETLERRRNARAGRRGQPRLCDADDAVGRRHARDRRGAEARAFRTIVGPHKEDICYATTNRQEAVKRVAPLVDAMIVVGSPNSSNSQRLREVAERAGCPLVRLVLRADGHRLVRCSAASAGSASRPAPRRPRCWSKRSSTPSPSATRSRSRTVSTADENVFFPLPRELRGEAAE